MKNRVSSICGLIVPYEYVWLSKNTKIFYFENNFLIYSQTFFINQINNYDAAKFQTVGIDCDFY